MFFPKIVGICGEYVGNMVGMVIRNAGIRIRNEGMGTRNEGMEIRNEW